MAVSKKGSSSPAKSDPSPSPPADTEDERSLLEAAMKGVRPLTPGPSRITSNWYCARERTTEEARPSQYGERHEPSTVAEADDDADSFAASGVRRADVRRLRRGEIQPEAKADLHGLGSEQAKIRIRAFVEDSLARRLRCVLVIHGRGTRSGTAGPVLKTAVIKVLQNQPLKKQVLAYSPAPPRLGGAGALLVLLRRTRRNN